MDLFAAHADHVDALLRERRSVRGFRPDPVPHSIIRQAFAAAQSAPSNCNVQPWVVHVVSGAAAADMRQALLRAAMNDVPFAPDVPITQSYPGEYRRRQIDSAKALFAATGIAREDIVGRTRSHLRNFSFFDAPHAGFVFMPEWGDVREASDCGMYAQSLLLALAARGIGSCAQGSLSYYPDIVRQELGIAGGVKLLFGIAFGYEDTAHPANAARTERAGPGEITFFHDRSSDGR